MIQIIADKKNKLLKLLLLLVGSMIAMIFFGIMHVTGNTVFASYIVTSGNIGNLLMIFLFMSLQTV